MITIDLNINDLLGKLGAFPERTAEILRREASILSNQAHAKVIEFAQSELRSTREAYLDALSFSQVDENTWLIQLDASALWIEDGKKAGSMLDDLLKSPKAKQGKNGKYLSVPFQHNKNPTATPMAAMSLRDTVQNELRKRGINMKKIENDAQGKPLTGLLHKVDIMSKPVKTGQGVYQGKGPVGAVRQGRTGIPFLQGIRVYQKESGGSVKRFVMTFRTASESQRGQGMWEHPGTSPKKFLDKVAEWIITEWETKVKGKVAEELGLK